MSMLKRRPIQCVGKNIATSPATQARACLSTSNQASRRSFAGFLSRTQRLGRPKVVLGMLQSHRGFSATSAVGHGHFEPPKPGEELWVTFVDKDGDEHKLAVNEGDNLLTVAQANDIEMEGACEGSLSCSTCHVIVEDEVLYDKMPEATDEENDMLDLAFGLTETSRLGCQVIMTKELDGLRVHLPSMTRNLQAKDFEAKK